MERFVFESKMLWKHPEEAVLLMRLGALANAISSAISLMSSLSTGVGQERDTLQSMLLVTSYFKEAVDLVNTKHTWPLVESAVANGYQLPVPLSELRRLYSRDSGSLYKRGVCEVRRTKGFHVDEDHFLKWVAQLQSPYVTLWRKDSASPLDWAFTASAQIQSYFGSQLEDADSLAVAKASTYLHNIVEAIACGLSLKVNIDPRTAWRPMAFREVRFEHEFFDERRPSFCDTAIVAMDVSGDLTSAVHDLRDHVTHVHGGRRADARTLGQDAPIELSTDRGTARAWPARLLSQGPPCGPAADAHSAAGNGEPGSAYCATSARAHATNWHARL